MNDSFSMSDNIKNEDENRYDSPIFGTSDNKMSSNKIIFTNEDEKDNENINRKEVFSDKLMKMQNKLKIKEDTHKQQVLHLETMGMMTKYQLVFIKLENGLLKTMNIMKNSSFYDILTFASLQKYQSKLKAFSIYYSFESKLTKLYIHCEKIKILTFRQIFDKLLKSTKKTKQELFFIEEIKNLKNEFSNEIAIKNQELSVIKKKYEESQNVLMNLQNKKNENNIKFKEKEKQISSLETQLLTYSKTKTSADETVRIKYLEQRIKELETEISQLKEKVNYTECNVSVFIKEMNDFLDTQEISTNAGSEENLSLNISSQDVTKKKDKKITNLQKSLQQEKFIYEKNKEKKSHRENIYSSISPKGVMNSHK